MGGGIICYEWTVSSLLMTAVSRYRVAFMLIRLLMILYVKHSGFRLELNTFPDLAVGLLHKVCA